MMSLQSLQSKNESETFPQDGASAVGRMLTSSDESTPTSVSPIDILSKILNDNDDDDDIDSGVCCSDERSSASDKSEDGGSEAALPIKVHLPLFQRCASGGIPSFTTTMTSVANTGNTTVASDSRLFGLDQLSFHPKSLTSSNSLSSSSSLELNGTSSTSGHDPLSFHRFRGEDPFNLGGYSGKQDSRPLTASSSVDLFLSDDLDVGAGMASSSLLPNFSMTEFPNSALVSAGGSGGDGDLQILNEAVSLAALNLREKESPPMEPLLTDPTAGWSNNNLLMSNLKALASIDQQQQQLQHQQRQVFSRQLSTPPDPFSANFAGPAFGRSTNFSGLTDWNRSDYYNGRSFNNSNGLMSNQTGSRIPYGSSFSFPATSALDIRPSSGELGDHMQVRLKFGQLGQGPYQFNEPTGFCIGREEEIVVADTKNHRIQVFDKNGNFRFLFGRPGTDDGFLWYPRKVTVLRHSGCFVVCDRGGERSRMQLFDDRGLFIRRIHISGISIVASVTATPSGLIAVVDSGRRAIFLIEPESGRLRYIDCSNFMTEPSDIAVYKDNFYLCDYKDHSVVVVSPTGRLLRKFKTDAVTLFPSGIDISDAGDIVVGDSHGNKFHVAVFDEVGNLVSHFHCPQVKATRCCGLSITSEGYIVTLVKNYHHILVINTLSIE